MATLKVGPNVIYTETYEAPGWFAQYELTPGEYPLVVSEPNRLRVTVNMKCIDANFRGRMGSVVASDDPHGKSRIGKVREGVFDFVGQPGEDYHCVGFYRNGHPIIKKEL